MTESVQHCPRLARVPGGPQQAVLARKRLCEPVGGRAGVWASGFLRSISTLQQPAGGMAIARLDARARCTSVCRRWQPSPRSTFGGAVSSGHRWQLARLAAWGVRATAGAFFFLWRRGALAFPACLSLGCRVFSRRGGRPRRLPVGSHRRPTTLFNFTSRRPLRRSPAPVLVGGCVRAHHEYCDRVCAGPSATDAAGVSLC